MKRYMILIVLLASVAWGQGVYHSEPPKISDGPRHAAGPYLPVVAATTVGGPANDYDYEPVCYHDGFLQRCDGFWGWERNGTNGGTPRVKVSPNLKGAFYEIDESNNSVKAWTVSPTTTSVPIDAVGTLSVQDYSQHVATVDVQGKVLVQIDKSKMDALLSCDSVWHEWVDGPELVSDDSIRGEYQHFIKVKFQHCSVCGVLRIKPENQP